MRRSLFITLWGAIIWTAVAQTRMAAEPPTTRPAVENPHWSAAGCSACHKNGAPKTIPAEQVNALCWSCHDGERASAEPHPVGRKFTRQQINKPPGWPTPDNLLSCITCHDVVVACHKDKPRPATNAEFLREPAADGMTNWCGKCHAAAKQGPGQRYNPHQMLDERGQIKSSACQLCHVSPMENMRAGQRGGQPHLRSDGISLCAACHRSHIDYFEPGHIGLRINRRSMDRLMKAVRPPTATMPASLPATRPAGAQPLLPLGTDQRIVCSTCHNPHPQGLFAAGSDLAIGAMTTATQGNQLGLRFGKDVCRACHE